MATLAQRHTLGTLMDYLVAHEPRIHYAMLRPMRTRHIATLEELRRAIQSGAITMDCSESVTLLCKLAGLKDPNGLGYDGAGYTGTLLTHLPHYSDPAAANVGGMVVFGPGTGEHVAMVRHPGSDPVLFSHGWEGGPQYVHLSVERRYHHPGVTMLSIANL